MKRHFICLLFFLSSIWLFAQPETVSVHKGPSGMQLRIDGEPMIIQGMNWDYFPIGTNYEYSLWNQSDELIQAALEAEMTLLADMGVNAIRQYTGVPARWITHIYKEYGIYTMLNHAYGRYGVSVNGEWIANTDYADPATKEQLMTEAAELAMEYKDTEGLLLYLLGNENNYGLFWKVLKPKIFRKMMRLQCCGHARCMNCSMKAQKQ